MCPLRRSGGSRCICTGHGPLPLALKEASQCHVKAKWCIFAPLHLTPCSPPFAKCQEQAALACTKFQCRFATQLEAVSMPHMFLCSSVHAASNCERLASTSALAMLLIASRRNTHFYPPILAMNVLD